MDLYVNGTQVALDPRNTIGQGGEADVYQVDGGQVLKLFKLPTHPDYEGDPAEQHAAAARLREHQQKLPAFPKGLPARVVAPTVLVTDRKGRSILGYTMPYLAGCTKLRKRSEKSGYAPKQVAPLFLDLHASVAALHRQGVILGDFNDLNVLISPQEEAWLIDADSFQFGPFPCRVFTARFLDPLLCDPGAPAPAPVRPYTPDSDWYAYAVMLFQSLLLVDPFGGVYLPKDPKAKVAQAARSLHGISVFHPEVRYPKPAVPYTVLPDDLLQQFHRIFVHRERGLFPPHLLQSLRWTTCTVCGREHARAVCPDCAHAAPTPGALVTTVRGEVICTRLFATCGQIVFATAQNGELRWVYHEGEGYHREDGSLILSGPHDPALRWRIQGETTLVGKGDRLAVLSPATRPSPQTVDRHREGAPLFDANGAHRYWCAAGQLLRDGPYGPELLGAVLQGQTRFWVGSRFGFGLTRAGGWQSAFLFDAERKHSVQEVAGLPRLTGQLVEATARFAGERCWLFLTVQEQGRRTNRCHVIHRSGQVEATAEAEEGDGSWLSSLRGKCPAGPFLLAATDEGIVRVEVQGRTLAPVKRFADTEPFIHADCELFAGSQGLWAVDRQEIRLLRMA